MKEREKKREAGGREERGGKGGEREREHEQNLAGVKLYS